MTRLPTVSAPLAIPPSLTPIDIDALPLKVNAPSMARVPCAWSTNAPTRGLFAVPMPTNVPGANPRPPPLPMVTDPMAVLPTCAGGLIGNTEPIRTRLAVPASPPIETVPLATEPRAASKTLATNSPPALRFSAPPIDITPVAVPAAVVLVIEPMDTAPCAPVR